ncbi:MAG TPA: haloacid dehalogenase-like hydrolase [Gaiellaceae bacterium]|nr:haloacid dehalogenase-like hydrolase [Gaiellaceae bacterium]
MRLVLDWDGTCTVRDTLRMVLERFGDREIFERVEAELVAGTTSYREIMEAEMATIAAPLEEVNAWLAKHARIRPGLAELAARGRPLILSSGFHETIEPLLAREGVEADVVANRVDAGPDGWRIRWRDPEPCPVCGEVCKRRSLPAEPFVYVGDGYSDRCAAQLAERVFATESLAAWLDEHGLPYEPFDDLHDVARAL